MPVTLRRMAVCLCLFLGCWLGGGCRGPERGEGAPAAVRVGAAWADARAALERAGARSAEIGALGLEGPVGAADGGAWELSDGRLLLVLLAPDAGGDPAIARLEVCAHPERPKAQREWRAVDEVP